MSAAAGLASWRAKAVTFDNADEPSEDAINGELFKSLSDSGLQAPARRKISFLTYNARLIIGILPN